MEDFSAFTTSVDIKMTDVDVHSANNVAASTRG
jgi:hypothetical protein